MSKLLIDDNPIPVLPKLAVAIGLHEAICLQQLHYWIMHVGPDGRRYGKVADGARWIRNTIEDWTVNNFPFLTTNQVYRAFKNLEKQNFIISRKDLNKIGYDRTKWYTVNYPILHTRGMEIALMQNPSRASEDTIPETTSEITKENTVVVTDEQQRPNVFLVYEQEIGVLTPMLSDELKDIEVEYPDGWFEKAVKEAKLSSSRISLKYVVKILDRWKAEGLPNEYEDEDEQPKHEPRQVTTIDPFTGEKTLVTI